MPEPPPSSTDHSSDNTAEKRLDQKPETALPSKDSGEVPLSPLVWIVVLHWRGLDVTRRCLASLGDLRFTNYKTLVVDNGSENNDGATLAAEFESIEVLRLSENLGFSGGSNQGMKACLEKQADYIWLLNNDTTVSPDSLSSLVEEAARQKKAALLGAAIVERLAGGENTVVASAGKIDFRKAKTSVVKSGAVSQAVACEWLHGANLLIKSEALREVGMFDDRYYLYFEDTELCHRMRLAGWQCIFVPAAQITHEGSASTTGKRKHWRSYYYIRNRALFFETYLKGAQAIPARLSMLSHLVRHMLVLPFRGENGRSQLKAELLGYRDHLNKHYGKATCLQWCEE